MYDGYEQQSAFTDDMKIVPSESSDFSSWMAIVTYFDECGERSKISADVVYITNPRVRVTIRLKAMVNGLNFGWPK